VVNPRPYKPVARNPIRWLLPVGALAAIAVVASGWWAISSISARKGDRSSHPASQRDSRSLAAGKGADAAVERGEAPRNGQEEAKGDSAARVQAALEGGQRAFERSDLVTAQSQLSAALRAGATGQQAADIRAKLVKLGDQMIFSPEHVKGDPHSDIYLVQKGDSLMKIAKAFKATPDLIARVNNLTNRTMIREGSRLKVVKGPFSAVVSKKEYTLDVYLDDVMVRTYKVGLGEHGSTPTGTWRVKNKLENPTYFPPRGGKVVQADDPSNPLGEHWLGLEGVSGEAKNQERYGIHGTNEPASIGKDSSLGCIRMHNADVGELYTMLIIGDSQVTVKD
jgi:lipoprotein-anchoring transpeptidase ErfK/SrfK